MILKIKSIGNLKISRIKAISLIKNELHFGLKESKIFLDKLINRIHLNEWQLNIFETEIIKMIFNSVEIVEKTAVNEDIIKNELYDNATQWYNKLPEIEKNYVDILKRGMIATA